MKLLHVVFFNYLLWHRNQDVRKQKHTISPIAFLSFIRFISIASSIIKYLRRCTSAPADLTRLHNTPMEKHISGFRDQRLITWQLPLLMGKNQSRVVLLFLKISSEEFHLYMVMLLWKNIQQRKWKNMFRLHENDCLWEMGILGFLRTVLSFVIKNSVI